MAAKWIEALTGSLEQKKQYRDAKKRIDALPEPYRTTALAQHRYTMYYGGITDGDTLMQIFVDLADLWERASIDGTPIADITGDDPVEFTETYAEAYGGTQWIDKERARLIKAFDDAKKKESRS